MAGAIFLCQLFNNFYLEVVNSLERYFWEALLGILTLLGTFIGLVYRNITGQIMDLKTSLKEGFNLKVGTAEYKIQKEWEKDLFDGIRLSIKELKDENNTTHAAIMDEVKKGNNIFKESVKNNKKGSRGN